MANHPETNEPLLNVADVAELLRVSASLVYQLVESGKLVVYRIGNGRGAIRFRPQDIETYLSSCRTTNVATLKQAKKQHRARLKHIRLD